MKERRKALGEKPIEVRMWTLKDKKSAFRPQEPDRHCVEVIIKCGQTSVMIRDWWYDKPADAVAQYDRIISFLE